MRFARAVDAARVAGQRKKLSSEGSTWQQSSFDRLKTFSLFYHRHEETAIQARQGQGGSCLVS